MLVEYEQDENKTKMEAKEVKVLFVILKIYKKEKSNIKLTYLGEK